MSNLERYVDISIDKNTKAPTTASFNIPCIVGKFAANKTTVPFTRARAYADLAEMSVDGWSVKDAIYNAAMRIFSQARTVNGIVVGRWDTGDANLTAALTAIAAENNDWYGLYVVGSTTITITLSTALIAGNVISVVLNGTTVGPITYATSHASTMGALEDAIEAAFPGSTATTTGNALAIVLPGNDLSAVTTITGGASQPTSVNTWAQDTAGISAASAWTETQSRIFGWDSPDTTIAGSGTADIASTLKGLAYERTFGIVHKLPGEHACAAWIGKMFPKEVGSASWAYKELAGVTPDGFNGTEENNILGKNCSYYTRTAGMNHTFEGKTASGEFVDVIVGLDWIKARIKERIFGNRIGNDKVQMSDPGLQSEGAIIRSVLIEAEGRKILIAGSSSVVVPLYANIPDADKANRIATGYTFTAKIEGSIHRSVVRGTVTL